MGTTFFAHRKQNLKRGDIYYADLTGIENSIGCEQTGKRPVLVIQNNVGNFHSPTTIVATLTSKNKQNLPTHVTITPFACLEKNSTVCLEQIKTIDKIRLGEYLGNVGSEIMKKIDKAISISVGTDRNGNTDNSLHPNISDDFYSPASLYNNTSSIWITQLEILASNIDIQKISFALGNTLSSIQQLNNNVAPINILQKLLEKIN